MKLPDSSRVLRIACALALVALAMIVWSLFDPRPIPVILAMSVAQGLGTLSFAAFVVVVLRDLRVAMRAKGDAPPGEKLTPE